MLWKSPCVLPRLSLLLWQCWEGPDKLLGSLRDETHIALCRGRGSKSLSAVSFKEVSCNVLYRLAKISAAAEHAAQMEAEEGPAGHTSSCRENVEEAEDKGLLMPETFH